MHFHISAVQRKCFNPFDSNGWRLEFFFDVVEDSVLDSVTKAAIDCIPVANSFAEV